MTQPDPGQEIKAPVAKTAGEQDHSDPWAFAGEDADAPEGQSVQDGTGPEGEI